MQKEAVVAYFKNIISELTWKDSTESLKPSDYCMSRRRFKAGASGIQVRIVTAWTNTVCLFTSCLSRDSLTVVTVLGLYYHLRKHTGQRPKCGVYKMYHRQCLMSNIILL